MPFPSSLPAYAGFVASHTLSQDQHASQHNSEQADITAIATKVGTGASTPSNNTVLRGNGAGTTTYDQVHAATDISGILGTANGGTGTTATTGTGSNVFGTSPTLTTPTINSPTTTNVNNSSGLANTGGLTTDTINVSSTITVPTGSITTPALSNPYKFFAYLNNTANLVSSATKMPFEAKLFDTGNNFDAVTNHRFTAPIAGFYFFQSQAYVNGVADGTEANIWIYKNGNQYANNAIQAGSNADVRAQISLFMQLAVNDFIEIFVGNNQGTRNWLGLAASGVQVTWFQGFLVSAT